MKKASIYSLIILGLGSLLLFQDCAKEHFPESPVCFSEEVTPIILSNCTQSDCHNPFDKARGLDLTTYEGILKIVNKGSYQKSKLYQVLVNETGEVMPQEPYSPLNDDQIKTIARWIQEGAVNLQNCQSACDTTQAGFAANVFPIIQTNCNGCHSGANPQGGIDLSTYAKIKPFVINDSFLGSILQESGYSPMPKNGNKISHN
jgi:hypothetical protein